MMNTNFDAAAGAWERMRRAAADGAGVRLTWDECCELLAAGELSEIEHQFEEVE